MIQLPIEIGDQILTGRFKNHRVIVKEIGVDDNGHPTINGRGILKIRIEKLMQNKVNEMKESTNSNITANFLKSLGPKVKDEILTNIAKHYGISNQEAFEEVTDDDAESIMDYVTGSIRSTVSLLFNKFKGTMKESTEDLSHKDDIINASNLQKGKNYVHTGGSKPSMVTYIGPAATSSLYKFTLMNGKHQFAMNSRDIKRFIKLPIGENRMKTNSKKLVESRKTDAFKKGTVILVHGFVMLKGLDNGNYYVVTNADDESITFSKTNKNGKLPSISDKRIRFKKWDIEGMLNTFNRGDNNGIEVIKENRMKTKKRIFEGVDKDIVNGINHYIDLWSGHRMSLEAEFGRNVLKAYESGTPADKLVSALETDMNRKGGNPEAYRNLIRVIQKRKMYENKKLSEGVNNPSIDVKIKKENGTYWLFLQCENGEEKNITNVGFETIELARHSARMKAFNIVSDPTDKQHDSFNERPASMIPGKPTKREKTPGTENPKVMDLGKEKVTKLEEMLTRIIKEEINNLKKKCIPKR